jgi:hypothetical protein
MAITVRIAPTNSLLFISDRNGGIGPEFLAGRLILSTSSCISVGCLMWQDGETEVTLGLAREVDPGVVAAFDGPLETPNRVVVVWTVEGEIVLKASVPATRTRVRIWVNRPAEPDRVVVGLEE